MNYCTAIGLIIGISTLGAGCASAPPAGPLKPSLSAALGTTEQSLGDFEPTLKARGYRALSTTQSTPDQSFSISYQHPIGNQIALDASYIELGQNTLDIDATLPAGTDINAAVKEMGETLPVRGRGPALSARYIHQFNCYWSVWAQAGAFAWSSDRKAHIGALEYTADASGVSPIVETGAALTFDSGLKFQMHLQHIALPDTAVKRLAFGIGKQF